MIPEDFSFADAIGIVGSLTVCSAYFLVSRGRLDPERLPYHLTNLAGAALLLVSLYFRPNPGAILIEAIWVAIALTAIFGIVFRRRRD